MDLRHRALISGAIIASLCVLVWVHFLNQPVETTVSLELESSADSYAQLYYDSGNGFDEAHSAKKGIKATPPGVFQLVRFQFRISRLRALRLDPAVVPGRFAVRHMLVQVEGRDLLSFAPTDIKPLHDLSECSSARDSIRCEASEHASDPQFLLQLPRSLNLSRLVVNAYGRPIMESIALLIAIGIGAVLATSGKGIDWIGRLFQSRGMRALLRLNFAHLVAGTFLLFVLRRPDVLANPQLWAEDGAVFFLEDLRLGFWHALITPYAGYLHLIPRLIAGVSSILPARVVPVSFNLAALSLEAVSCSAFFLPCCRDYIRSDGIRAAVCLVMACAIPTGHELVGTISNVQWWLLIPGLILLMWVPKDGSRWKVWAAAAAGLSIALSAALLVIAVPLVVVRYALGRYLPPVPAAITLFGTAIQGAVGMGNMAPQSGQAADLVSTLRAIGGAWLSRPMLQTFCGERFVRSASDRELAICMALALCITVIGLTALLFRLEQPGRLVVSGALYLGGASLGLVIVGRHFVNDFLTTEGWRGFLGQRYFFLPSAMLIFLVGVAVQRFCGRRTFAGVLLLAALFGTGVFQNFRAPQFVDLHWPAYAPQIDRWKEAKSTGRAMRYFDVPINPQPWRLRFD